MAVVRPFMGSALVTLVCLTLAAAYGWADGGSAAAIGGAVWIVLVLALLEVSLSFDNAVVNASVLEGMAPIWRKRFLTWGIAIAVFGSRVLFPLAIVGVTAGIGPAAALRLSLTEPARYEAIVSGAHIAISGFGGAFLAMVGLGFFIDGDKAHHWLGWVERGLQGLAAVRSARVALVLVALLGIAASLPAGEALRLLGAGIFGIIAFVLVDGLGQALESGAGAIKGGLGAFLYLNLLDISFSLDGVIGAFALSNNMVIIALGLSIGAVFVRSLTMVLVAKGTLGQLRYLEHGAFWAITALAAIMLVSARAAVPEWLTGGIGAALIGAAAWSSRRSAAA